MGRRPVDIDTLYAAHREPLLLWFVRRTADPQVALDLWAETFAQAVTSQRRYRGDGTPDALAAWLYGIARRQLAQFYRRGAAEQRALTRLKLERPAASETIGAELLQRAGLARTREELSSALAEISPDVRTAVVLRVLEELSYAEIARRLDIAETAARARVSRGLRTLADHIDAENAREALRA